MYKIEHESEANIIISFLLLVTKYVISEGLVKE